MAFEAKILAKRLLLVDTAEETEQWLRQVRKQWGDGEPIALRFKVKGKVLGSTFPQALQRQRGGWWGIDWTSRADEDAFPNASDPCAHPQRAPVNSEPALAPAASVDAQGSSSESQPATSEISADRVRQDDDHQAVADVAARGSASCADDKCPVDAVPATAAESGHDEPRPTEAVNEKECSGPETAAKGEGCAETLRGSVGPTLPLAHEGGQKTGVQEECSCSSTVAEEPVSVDCTLKAFDPLCIELITLRGAVLGASTVDVTSFVNGTSPTEEYRIFMIPLSAPRDDSMVFVVIELGIARPNTYQRHELLPAGRVSRGSGATRMPVFPLTPVVRVNSRDLYFPPWFVCGSGIYVVTNILCVENSSAAGIIVELVAANPTQLVMVKPSASITVSPGERTFFSVTWSVFQPFSSLTEANAPLGMHLNVHTGSETHTTRLNVHGAPPLPCDRNEPYHFWVNTTCITNSQYSPTVDLPRIKELLPVFWGFSV